MAKPMITLLTAVLLVVGLAGGATAVTTVTVTSGGAAVPGATVTLDTGETAQSDADGKATFPTVTPGTHTATITSPDTLKRKTSFVVPSSGDTSVSVGVDRAYPWMAQNPPGGGFGVGPFYEGTWLDDMRITKDVLTDRTAFGTFRTAQTAAGLRDENRANAYRLEVNQTGLDVPVGLPSFTAGDCVSFHPGVSLLGGYNHATLRQRDRFDRGDHTTLIGDGFSWGVGSELVIAMVPGHPDHRLFDGLYSRFGYAYRGGHVDLERTPRDSGAAGLLGATVRSEDGNLDWSSHRFYGHVGYSFFDGKFAPYVGAQYSYHRVSLDTHARVTVPFFGDVRRDSSQAFRRDDLRAVIGVETRPFGSLTRALSPLYARGEIAFNDSSFDAFLKFVYQFGGVDP